jgi:chromosome segregation ATPase
LTREFSPKSLPLFLRELQIGKISDSNFIQEIIPILGGVNIEKLQQELQALQEQVNSLSIENKSLSKNAKVEVNKVNTLVEENKSLKAQLIQLKEQNSLLDGTAKEQEKLLSLDEVNIEKLQQECKSLQEHVNFLLIENGTLSKSEKIVTDKVNELIEENKLLKEQLLQLEIQNSSYKFMEEQEKMLICENMSLKEQIIKLNNEIRLLPPKNSGNLLNPEIKTEKQVETRKATITIPDVTLPIKGVLSQFAEKANQQILNEPDDNDKEINDLIERLQHPMAHIRESTLNDIKYMKTPAPRVVEVIEKLATSDRVDIIRNLAQKTLITLKKNAKG